MLVELDPWLRRAIEQALAEDGYNVVRVEELRDAPRLARGINPATILLDIPSPSGEGLLALQELRRCAAEAVIVVLSATVTVRSARDAMLLGADDYVAKPFDMALLRLVVRDGLGERWRAPAEHACAC